jgi:hypothetical protein
MNNNHKTDWYYEGNISRILVNHFAKKGFNILNDNSDNIRAKGEDIIIKNENMKRYSIIIILIFLRIVSYSQTPSFQWANSIGGNDLDYPIGITVDKIGNTFFIGSFRSKSIQVGTLTVTNKSYAATMQGMFLAKYNKNGEVIWAKSLNRVILKSITSNVYGDVLITGTFTDTVTLGNIKLTSVGKSDIFLLKYNTNGDVLWVKTAGGTDDEVVNRVVVNSNNDVVIAGAFKSSVMRFGTTILRSPINNSAFFIAKYTEDGNLLWAKKLTSSYLPFDIATDSLGSLFVAGTISTPNIIFGFDTLVNNNYTNIFLAKYDIAGELIWAKTVGADSMFFNGITTNNKGDVLITGGFYPNIIHLGNSTLINKGNGTSDIYILKINSYGNLIWAKSAGGTSTDVGQKIITDTIGNIYITGWFLSPSISFGTNILTNSSNKNTGDFICLSMNAEGSPLWAKSFGGNDSEAGNDVCFDKNGSLCLIGDFTSPTITIGNKTLTNIGGVDCFITKISTLTGIELMSRPLGMIITPNPISDYATIKFEKEQINTIILIVDELGRIIKEVKFSGTEYNIEKVNFKNGVYNIVAIDNKKCIIEKKIIIN